MDRHFWHVTHMFAFTLIMNGPQRTACFAKGMYNFTFSLWIKAIDVICQTRHTHTDRQLSNLRFAPALNEPLRNNERGKILWYVHEFQKKSLCPPWLYPGCALVMIPIRTSLKWWRRRKWRKTTSTNLIRPWLPPPEMLNILDEDIYSRIQGEFSMLI